MSKSEQYTTGRDYASAVLGISTHLTKVATGTDMVVYNPLEAAQRATQQGAANAGSGANKAKGVAKLWRKIPPSLRAGGAGALALGLPGAGLAYASNKLRDVPEEDKPPAWMEATLGGLAMGAFGGHQGYAYRNRLGQGIAKNRKIVQDVLDSGLPQAGQWGDVPPAYRKAVDVAAKAAPNKTYTHAPAESDFARNIREQLERALKFKAGPPPIPDPVERAMHDPKFQKEIIDEFDKYKQIIKKGPGHAAPRAAFEIQSPLLKGLGGEELSGSSAAKKFVRELIQSNPELSTKQLMAMLHPDKLMHSKTDIDPTLASQAFQELRSLGNKGLEPSFDDAVHGLGKQIRGSRIKALDDLDEASQRTFPNTQKLDKTLKDLD